MNDYQRVSQNTLFSIFYLSRLFNAVLLEKQRTTLKKRY